MPDAKWVAVQRTPRCWDFGRAGGPTNFEVRLPRGWEPDELFEQDVQRVLDGLNIVADREAALEGAADA